MSAPRGGSFTHDLCAQSALFYFLSNVYRLGITTRDCVILIAPTRGSYEKSFENFPITARTGSTTSFQAMKE
jgi:hypothetical protein